MVRRRAADSSSAGIPVCPLADTPEALGPEIVAQAISPARPCQRGFEDEDGKDGTPRTWSAREIVFSVSSTLLTVVPRTCCSAHALMGYCDNQRTR